MTEFESMMIVRKEKLLQMKKALFSTGENQIEGTLRIHCVNGRTQYFRRMEADNTTGTYIPKKDVALAQALAQKDYDRRTLRSIERELKAIERYIESLPQVKPEEVYETLHIERQKLIIPIRETDHDYIKHWEEQLYQKKEIDVTVPVIETEKGERVRSKSEMMIANVLKEESVPYKYECPLYLNGYGWVHPDFTTLNIRKRKEIYWEHLGLMDDPSYAEKNLQKLTYYEKNGYILGDSLVITWETKKYPLTKQDIKRMILQHCK